MKQVTDNTLKTINADIQKQMIADMGNVFNDSATFTPIKQWLTSEHNIREMLAHGGLENEGFDITLSSHYSKDSSKTFWVETSQGSTYADFNFDLYYNLEVSDDTIIDLVSNEISKIDLTTYIDKLDKKKIYQIKNYRHKLYFDSKLLDDKKIGRALRIYMLQHNVKQLKDVIPYEKLYDLVGENIKDLFGQHLKYGPGIGVGKLLKLLKTEITYDFEPVDDIRDGSFDNVTATMRLTFASTKFDGDSLAKMKDTINKLYKTKLPEFLSTSSFAEGILQKYADDEDLMKGQVVKNVPLVKLEYPDFEGVDGYDLRLSKTGDNGIYVDFFIDDDLFALCDMIYDMTDYKWISETLVKEFTEKADENGLIVENFKVDSSSDLIIYGDIKAKHVRKMYQDGSFRQLTLEIDKQMSEVKKEVTALQDKLIDRKLETVTLELKDTLCSMQKFPEYNFAVYLDAPSIEISKELNVVLQNTGSTDIYVELIANNIAINVPRGLLDKYNVSMNDFTDVKAFINKNYSFLFNVDAVQTKYYYMIMKKLDNFCSTVNANQREFGLKFIKLSGLDSGNSELRNIGDDYSIRTFKIQDYVFTLDNINVNETYDKVKLSTSKFVSVGYSVVLEK